MYSLCRMSMGMINVSYSISTVLFSVSLVSGSGVSVGMGVYVVALWVISERCVLYK